MLGRCAVCHRHALCCPEYVMDDHAMVQVWFKHDLRLDDHPGLSAALDRAQRQGSSGLVLAFVLDPAFYSHLLATPSGVQGV